jgi:hypothetical protein
MDLGEKGMEGVGWIHLTQVRDHWQAPVDTVVIRVP